MENLWNDPEARRYGDSDLSLRVYTSRLLGRDDGLVLHGGGNTSVKTTEENIFGEEEDILYVKGSGWDLKTIEAPGFAPCRLRVLKRLGNLEHMTDTQMARELKASMTNPAAPAPSVEAILHALIPPKFVDHTHADAVVAISNTADGEALLKDLYGDRVLILPYVMPGFVLARQVFEATRDVDWKRLDGIVLLHHGVFTFHEDARTSYDRMIELVTQAEELLQQRNAFASLATGNYSAADEDYLSVAQARRRVSDVYGNPVLARWKRDRLSVGYSCIENIEDIATRGPVTPDHTLNTKRTPALLEDDIAAGITHFTKDYASYFEQHRSEGLICLDLAPRFAVWREKGCLIFGPNLKRLTVISDIVDHTIRAVQWGEALGGWKALPEKDIFDLEYWELEQAKLVRGAARKENDGKVAVVTGAASGIGKACVEALSTSGSAVVALDINPDVEHLFDDPGILGRVCDVTSSQSIATAVWNGIERFGGIDILVSNAGLFPLSVEIEKLADDALQESIDINFSAHVKMMRACIPYLKLGIDPTIILMASKNVPAPGPGVGAYSATKAALTQIARVAAMELGGAGIRVNVLHPNAVFDTGVWSEEVLQKRAEHYDLTVEEYKTKNILGTEITSRDVARLVVAVAGSAFAKTTGAQIPIDGGNERVI